MLLNIKVQAQQAAPYQLGIAVHTGMKLSTGSHRNWLGVYEPALELRVNGARPGSLGFTGSAGLLVDAVRFRLGEGSHFSIIQYNFSLRGLIRFPTRYERIQVLAGIGLEYAFEPVIGIGTFADYNTQTSVNMDLDSNFKAVEEMRRRLLPSVSAGLSYTFPHYQRMELTLLLQQNLIALFPDGFVLPYTLNHNIEYTPINYKPSYLKLGLHYRFG